MAYVEIFQLFLVIPANTRSFIIGYKSTIMEAIYVLFHAILWRTYVYHIHPCTFMRFGIRIYVYWDIEMQTKHFCMFLGGYLKFSHGSVHSRINRELYNSKNHLGTSKEISTDISLGFVEIGQLLLVYDEMLLKYFDLLWFDNSPPEKGQDQGVIPDIHFHFFVFIFGWMIPKSESFEAHNSSPELLKKILRQSTQKSFQIPNLPEHLTFNSESRKLELFLLSILSAGGWLQSPSKLERAD